MHNSLARLHWISWRFIAARQGVAAIEFAMVLPVLALIFLVAFDGGRAIAIYLKVRAATYALGAVTNQYSTIASTDMTDITGSTALILQPYSSTPETVTVSQIAVNSSSSATVAWSYSRNGTALTVGSKVTLPTNLATCGSYPCYLIYSQVSYAFAPMFGFFTGGTLNLSDNLYVTPRSSTCIVYTPQTGTACTAK